MKKVKLVGFILFLNFLGCSSFAPTPIEPPPLSPEVKSDARDVIQPPYLNARCSQFCETIQSCSQKVGHTYLGKALCEIARCETGQKCISKINSRRNRYRGPFQFASRTWKSQCTPIFLEKKMTNCLLNGKVYDSCCAAICAAEMIDRGGIRNWPVCGRRIKPDLLKEFSPSKI